MRGRRAWQPGSSYITLIAAETKAVTLAFSDFKSLCRAPELISLIGVEIEKVNCQFARVEQIKQFRLIEQRLTAEDEVLTPTMKLKRSLINRKYAELIEGMYQGQATA